jgi:transposase
VTQVLNADPFCGHLFLFRSKRADYLKILYYDGTGLCLFAKRLEKRQVRLAANRGWRNGADARAIGASRRGD